MEIRRRFVFGCMGLTACMVLLGDVHAGEHNYCYQSVGLEYKKHIETKPERLKRSIGSKTLSTGEFMGYAPVLVDTRKLGGEAYYLYTPIFKVDLGRHKCREVFEFFTMDEAYNNAIKDKPHVRAVPDWKKKLWGF